METRSSHSLMLVVTCLGHFISSPDVIPPCVTSDCLLDFNPTSTIKNRQSPIINQCPFQTQSQQLAPPLSRLGGQECPPSVEFAEKLDKTPIGVGTGDRTPPLPPNRTCGFPASGSPVSGLLSETSSLWLGPWLRRSDPSSAKEAFGLKPLPLLIPLSRVASTRSVHTLASVYSPLCLA